MAPHSVAIFCDNGDVLFRDEQMLRRIHRDGRELWKLDLSAKVEPAGQQQENHQSPVIGPDGTIYCPFANWLVAITPTGEWKWNHLMSETFTNLRNGSRTDWATFTRGGELVFITGEMEILISPATAGGGSAIAFVARKEGVRCVGADGVMKWKQTFPSAFSWYLPQSRWELEVLWKSRMGLRTAKHLTRLTTTPDGTLYLSGQVNGKTRIWAIRGD
jgi:hypothetical protein